ncbi:MULTISPECIES: hypothetical protein [Thermoanaerobacterium]|uniref:Uncharacterized protein n=3 Tax=Thermoanaerobacterium TaxID=28895 RepID=L0ILG2_THETR|nr:MULTISPECIES: hypothetical protein [Thermoanaerobacterium]AFK94302.1 hypothetical protein Tsac_2755 [Thermoanaerobacterium saccharolyticum JW/SL-YS485]AGB20340.1 hypothetical protein Thethe_02786 [Thermoanaerobacterium thermosaccharolyticum M0795]ETO37218.1 hypothetical protein V518_2623 [Thermoanaerobacterium aotearoense SCUT27]
MTDILSYTNLWFIFSVMVITVLSIFIDNVIGKMLFILIMVVIDSFIWGGNIRNFILMFLLSFFKIALTMSLIFVLLVNVICGIRSIKYKKVISFYIPNNVSIVSKSGINYDVELKFKNDNSMKVRFIDGRHVQYVILPEIYYGSKIYGKDSYAYTKIKKIIKEMVMREIRKESYK